MARSDILTMIPLDRAALILGVDPFHFNSIVTLQRPENNACDDIWFQNSWQRQGQLGREDLAVALRQAEDTVTKYLGYFLIPQWVQEEEKVITKPYSPELTNITSRNSRGQAKSVVTDRGYVIEGGRKASTLIEEGSATVYSDENNDGYDETCTVVVPTTVTDPQEIHVYFPGKNGDSKWEIRPTTVTLSGGDATIVFPRYLVPLPELWTNEPIAGDVWRTINGDDLANFLEIVDVYRVYNDPQSQAVLYTEGITCDTCSGTGCQACGWTTNTACIRIRDSRKGIVTYSPATWDADTEQFNFLTPSSYRDPDKLYIWYRSGLINNEMDSPYLQMEPIWERLVVYYAVTLLDRNMNGCENTQNIWQMMTTDLAKSLPDGSNFQVSNRDISNPLGTKYASIRLWRLIESNRLLQGR